MGDLKTTVTARSHPYYGWQLCGSSHGVLLLTNFLLTVYASISQDHLRLEGGEGGQEGVLGEGHVTLSHFLLLGSSLASSSYHRPG